MKEFEPPLRRYEERWNDWRQKQPRLADLRNILLTHGGTEMVPQREPDVDELVENGRLLETTEEILIEGPDIDCHTNAAYFYLDRPDITEVGTGWALSDDGLWRQHSWTMRGDELVETTVPRELYYGVLLSGKNAKLFADKNRL